jgi:hypothetical protein
MLSLFYVDQKENHLGSLFCVASALQIPVSVFYGLESLCGLSACPQC